MLMTLALLAAMTSAPVDCAHAPISIGGFLGLHRDTRTKTTIPAMAADLMKLSVADQPEKLAGWLFVDQFGYNWIEAADPSALRFQNATKSFLAEVAIKTSPHFLPKSVSLDPGSVDVLHCDLAQHF